ncbi:MAG: haloacid dehalogenase-like hydrolase [Erysipelotrichaceae bacterium]|nr:haloacid dehalogenase-like hydrolase [Erysipelotrichaceae bacterium]
MSKRLISMPYSEIEKLNSRGLLEAIALGEGRTLAAECVCSVTPLLSDVSNAEVVSSLSADFVVLNMFDVEEPYAAGLPACEKKDTIRMLKKLIGRPVSINLEPVEVGLGSENLWAMTKGRMATAENALKAKEMGVDMITITGNPGNNVTNEAIVSSIREIRNVLGDSIILITGKMHASGNITEAGEKIIDKNMIKEFIEAGADIIMVPAVGTIPGLTLDIIHELISYIHSYGKLAMTAIGTSQEGSDTETIRRIAFNCKEAGADIHHIGDSGYVGMALPENILAYSIAIRGVRHTYHKIGQSINR